MASGALRARPAPGWEGPGPMNTYDVCIVGAGVVGCAIARELVHRRWDTPLRIVVLEQHDRVAEESSGRNSGVLHSGIHEHPSSLKGQLAREGSALAVSYAIAAWHPAAQNGNGHRHFVGGCPSRPLA